MASRGAKKCSVFLDFAHPGVAHDSVDDVLLDDVELLLANDVVEHRVPAEVFLVEVSLNAR